MIIILPDALKIETQINIVTIINMKKIDVM
jgi:hypothetical protein